MRLVARALWSALYAVTLVPIAFGGGTALAADIFVDAVNGNDATGDGSSGNPYQTIGKGVSVGSSGDTVRAQAGDYNQTLESFPIEMVPGVSVVADAGTLQTFISTDTSDTLIEFRGASFDAATKLQGFNLRGIGSTAQNDATGVEIHGTTKFDSSLAPIIQDNVLSGLGTGVDLSADNSVYATDVSPVIHNNVFQSINNRAITGYAAQSDTMSPTITQNLIDASYVDDTDTYGIYLWAEGGDGDDTGGAVITADIESNVILRSYYSVYLYAGAGTETTIAPRLADGGLAPTIEGTVSSGGINSNFSPNPFGGSVKAYVVNNRMGSLDNMYTVGVSAFAQGYDDQGGSMDVTVRNNTLFSGYGVYLATFSFFSDDQGVYGAQLRADVSDNLMDSTYYDNSFHTGVYTNASGQSGELYASVRNNEITNGYGVLAQSEGSFYASDPGGLATVVVADNIIDGTTFNEDSYGVFASSDGGNGSFAAGDSGSGGTVELTVQRNKISATYGVYLQAEGGADSGDIGYGGVLNATIDSNTIESFNQYQVGQGISSFSGDSGSNGSPRYTGGTVDLIATNNVIRAYDGIYLEIDGYANDSDEAGKASAAIVNNTVFGGGIGNDYDEGYGILTFGATNLSEFHPVIDNNIVIMTPESDHPPVYLGFNTDTFSDPDSLDNNDTLHRQLGGPVASLRDVFFYSTGVVNTFPFADDNISTEPNFACESQGNARLLPNSVLIDAGKPNGLDSDFEGDLRPIGGGIDIGADEYNGTQLGTTFQDVGPASPYYLYVEALAAAGITGGCKVSPPLYCPSQVVSREQMAIFIVRALGAAPNSTGPQLFADVPSSRFSFPYIQTLAQLGITGGCGGGNFCPLAPVTRAEMAVFLIRALQETPDASLPAIFSDVAAGSLYYPFIQRLAKIGVTNGCAPGAYCPTSPVTREQMAAFIVRGFDLPVPLPCIGRIADKHGLQPGVVPEGLAPDSTSAGVVALSTSDSVLLASSGVASGAGAVVKDRSPSAIRGASQGIGPVGNSYLKLTSAQRDRLTAKRASSTPRRNELKGKPATAGLSKSEFRTQLASKVASFESDWKAKGRNASDLNMRKVRAMLAREMRYPSASKPVDVDKFVMRRQVQKAGKVRGKGTEQRARFGAGVSAGGGADSSAVRVQETGGRVRSSSKP